MTVPKALAEKYGIRPGDDIEWEAAGDVIRIVTACDHPSERSVAERLQLFDQAEERQRRREAQRETASAEERGWTREDLCTRGRSR